MSTLNYNSFLTRESKARKPSAIRALQPLLNTPGMISLGGGNPHPCTFPFVDMSITVKQPGYLDANAPTETLHIDKERMAVALQYSATNGLPPLVQWFKTLQLHQHQPPHQDFDVMVGNGSQDVLTKAFQMLIEQGDTLLIDCPAYVGSLAFLRPLGARFAQVDTDQDGLIPEKLHDILSSWKDPSTRPRVLYTVPCGGNPTGLSTSFERKKAIYQIARQFNLIILEDDPYYYLQFDTKIPSYFSIDTDQRVLRFDSLSKILSSGLRVGWCTGPKPLIERLVLHGQSTLLHTSGISQTLTQVLLEHWGLDGFYHHVDQVAAFYKQKRDAFQASAEKYLSGADPLAEWVVPKAGMFFWLKLLGIPDSSSLIKQKAVEKKVLLVPGFEFFPNETVTPYCRASFSTASVQDIDVALQRLAELLKDARKNE